jgi:lipase
MTVLSTRSWGPADGRPVLAIHGVTGHAGRFRRLAEEGLPRCRVVSVDLRGHGHSTWAPPWNLETHVADLLDTLDDNGLDRVALLGHSFGGLLATWLYARAPDRIERLALVDPAIAIGAADACEQAEAWLDDQSWATMAEARADRLALRPPAGRAAVDEELAAHAHVDADGRVRLRVSRAAVVVAWSEMARAPVALPSPAAPILLVAAGQAAFVRPSTRTWLRGGAGDDVSDVTIDAGHMLYWDAFEETVAALAPFLQG